LVALAFRISLFRLLPLFSYLLLAGAICHYLEGWFSLQNAESLIHPPPALASSFSIWSTATNPQAIAFRSLAPQLPSFDWIQGVTNWVLDLENTCPSNHALSFNLNS
jgi:hypothetical protein